MTIQQTLVLMVMTAGTLLVLVSAWGLLRMPDIYMRLQAATKASSLGAGLVLAGAAISFGTIDAATRALATVAFILLTMPLAAHLVARTAHRKETKKWERTRRDDLQERR